MEVKISTLLAVADRILNHIVTDLGIGSIQIPDDHIAYWDVKSPARYKYNPIGAAPAPKLNNLSADWNVIDKFPADPAGRLPNLVELSNLLRAIGDNPGWVIPIKQEVDVAWNMSEDDLYKHLGVASLGTKSVAEAVESLKLLKSVADNTDANFATLSLGDSLQKKGKDLFDSLWNGLKDVVCTIYKDNSTIGDAKDLVTYIVRAVIALGVITNPLAVLVITIAVKKGLDKLCTT